MSAAAAYAASAAEVSPVEAHATARIGFPLAIITNRREKSANVIIAVFCATVYYLLALGAQGLSIEGKFPAEIIMWLPNAVGFLTVVIFNHKICAS